MAISLRCQCGANLKSDEDAAGRRGRCPICGRTLLFPGPRSAQTVAAAAVGEAGRNPSRTARSSSPRTRQSPPS